MLSVRVAHADALHRHAALPRRRHASPLLLDGSEDAERKERLRQLFGEDFRDSEEKELARVPMSRVEQPPITDSLKRPVISVDDDDDLAGRRIKEQRSTSELEQLLDVGARFAGLWTLIDGVRKGSLGSAITPGMICIARRDFPNKYIVCDQAYEVLDIYYQGMEGAEVWLVPVASIDLFHGLPRPSTACHGLSWPAMAFHGLPTDLRGLPWPADRPQGAARADLHRSPLISTALHCSPLISTALH